LYLVARNSQLVSRYDTRETSDESRVTNQ
jgi:hypothetical protein